MLGLFFGLILKVAIPLVVGSLLIWLGAKVAKVQNTSFRKSVLAAIILAVFITVFETSCFLVVIRFFYTSRASNILLPAFILVASIISYFIIRVFFRATFKQTFLVLLFSTATLIMAFPISQSAWKEVHLFRISRKADKMQKPDIYKPVLETMALYCQSLPKGMRTAYLYSLDNRWFPDAIRGIEPNVMEIGNCYASIGFRDGLEYFMEKQSEHSTKTKNVWSIELHRKGEKPLLLMTITLDADKKFDTPEWNAEFINKQERPKEQKEYPAKNLPK
ncbi:MAG: hypothetical protein AB1599_01395 [Planctomycetota bacterium]